MLDRRKMGVVLERLGQFPAVALVGPRQAGKTTLAERIAEGRRSVYLDLECPADLAKLEDPALYLSAHEDALVILDEVQRMPELFHETFQGETVWEGEVEVFTVAGHPDATHAYAWSHETDEGDRRYVVILGVGPVKSARDAVRAAIAAERQ